MTTTFADLGVPGDLVAALDRRGMTAPFEVQVATIPDALAGRDVLGRAPTGSGKTIAFGVPLIVALERAKPRRPRGLILSPTRELAEQIRRELEPFATARDRRILTVYGGVGFKDQLDGLRAGADLVVACPGRLIDLLDQGALSLDAVDRVVVDEADRMADMGFLPAVRQLLDLTSTDRQTVLFSATLDHDVQVLIDHYQNDPVTHQVGEAEPDLSLVPHRFIKTAAQQKLALAADLIDDAGPTMVFCRTRHGVDRVARQLKAAGVKAGWIHGGRTQRQRDAALHAFTTGKVAALVATDVAARGIHVDGVACVIHFDPPADGKDYTHRSGRTARAGAGGTVISFVNRDQERAANRMMNDVGLPSITFEAMPPLSDRADHVAIDVRSRKRPAADRQQRGQRHEPRGEQQASTAKPSRSRSSRPTERPVDSGAAGRRDRSSDKGAAPRADRPAENGASGQRRNGRPASGTAPTRNGSGKGKAKGAASRKAAAKATKRSGKPRPKNKAKNRSTSKPARSGARAGGTRRPARRGGRGS